MSIIEYKRCHRGYRTWFMKPLSALLAAGVTTGALALTVAGTEIKNLATVSYEDEHGNTYTAQSNESVVTVAPVYSAEISDDNSVTGAAGQTVYLPHYITNNGNVTDTFNLVSTNGYSIYEDINGNGQPDAGEPVVTSVSVAGGDTTSLVVGIPVPVTATAGDTFADTLTITSAAGGTVTDVGSNGDGDNATVQDLVTISADAVLISTKDSVVDYTANTITYTLTVKNVGGANATGVSIVDVIPANTTFASVNSTPGLLTVNGDTIPTIPVATIDETVLGEDLNGDGDAIDTGLTGIEAVDAVLPANTTVAIEYTVSFDPTLAAGTLIENTFCAQGNLDAVAGNEAAICSNSTSDAILQTFGVDADDTDGIGTDADLVDNDTQYTSQGSLGGTVALTNVITNNGNGPDSFDLSVDTSSSTFPVGTVFTFWDSTNSVQLAGNNTGTIAAGSSLNITVRAQLPSSISAGGIAQDGVTTVTYNAATNTYFIDAGANNGAWDEFGEDGVAGNADDEQFAITLTATSAGDNSVSDTKIDAVGSITGASVDLANSNAIAGFNDGGVIDADAFLIGSPITTSNGNLGGTVVFPLFVANEGSGSVAYILSASNIPAGWSVEFQTTGGAPITSTPSVGAGAIYEYQAVVTVSSVPSEANAGDYDITFEVTSSADATVTDRKLDRVTLVAFCDIVLEPNGSNQVQPGGTVDYTHLLSNNGNEEQTVTLSGYIGSDDGGADDDGWSGQILVDTNADGVPDASVTDEDVGTAGTQVVLSPGETMEVFVRTFAPATAANGEVSQYTLTATGGCEDVFSIDTTEVILGQVRLHKSAAVDTDGDCVADTAYEEVQSTQVEPGQRVIWRLEATNEGAVDSVNVIISDATTDFTTFDSASGLCTDDSAGVSPCSPATDAPGTPNSGVAPLVQWNVGTLVPGDTARAEFCVIVD